MVKGKFTLLLLGVVLGGVTALYSVNFGTGLPMETAFAAVRQQSAGSGTIYMPMIQYNDPDAIPGLPPGSYFEKFSGAPSTATPWNGDGLDITIHNRDQDQLYSMTPMQAQHGGNCSSPDNTHTVSNYNDVVFQCRNHLMTATYGLSEYGGYSMIYLTPAYIVDTSGDFMVSFDVSTFVTNPGRDWIDLWISPYDDNLQLALDEWLPDLQGEPRNALHFKLTQESSWFVEQIRNGNLQELDSSYLRRVDAVEPSKTVRTTHVLVVQGNRMRFGIPDEDLWWYDGPVPSFIRNWNGAVVQIGHHSYTPDKDCSGAACGPNTYHWDNIAVGPGQHMTMIKADKRLVSNTTNHTFVFDEPAPANSHLRFSGIGEDLEVSFDGGSTWQNAQVQKSRIGQTREHFKSYWMPIPAGTTSVRFRGGNWWGGEWAARDATIWSRVVPSGDLGFDPYSAAGKPMFSQSIPADTPAFNSDLFEQIDELGAFCEN